MARLKPDEIKFISFEGGGAAGLTIHPGVVETLQTLNVLTYDENWRQNNIRAFAGSSSGSVMATLTSVGYGHDEMAHLLNIEAFDMVFRLENLKLGEELKLNGVVKNRTNIAISPEPLTLNVLMTNPIGIFLDKVMELQSEVETYLSTSTALNNLLKNELEYRAKMITNTLNLIDLRRFPPSRMANYVEGAVENSLEHIKDTAAVALKELTRAALNLVVGQGKKYALDHFRMYYAHAIYKLMDHLLDSRYNIRSSQNNLLKIFKEDYAPYAGVQWRAYIDNLVAFAAYRVNHPEVKAYMQLPTYSEMRAAGSIKGLFLKKIAEAENAALASGGQSAEDTSKAYESYLNLNFEFHKDLFYPDAGAGISPLQITGANLSSQESHVFAAHTTPDMAVSDAVRIASGVPPVFKPIILGAGDVPGEWSWARQMDRFGTTPFMEGHWMDGGVFANSPITLLMPYESGREKALGIGIGISERKTITNITEFYTSMVNVVYERNVSATTIGPDRYIEMSNFGIALEKPRMSAAESAFYKAYGANEAFNYLMDLPGSSATP